MVYFLSPPLLPIHSHTFDTPPPYSTTPFHPINTPLHTHPHPHHTHTHTPQTHTCPKTHSRVPTPNLVKWVKGCGMGPWLVLVSSCFRENVVATCKIGSFLCSLDNLLQKHVIGFFFGNQSSKWRSFAKRAIFDQLVTFFSHQGTFTEIPSAHISLTYIHVFCSP